MSKGFCDHCWNWGLIADEDHNMCTQCKEIMDGRALRNERPDKESVRPLPKSYTRGRG